MTVQMLEIHQNRRDEFSCQQMAPEGVVRAGSNDLPARRVAALSHDPATAPDTRPDQRDEEPELGAVLLAVCNCVLASISSSRGRVKFPTGGEYVARLRHRARERSSPRRGQQIRCESGADGHSPDAREQGGDLRRPVCSERADRRI